MRGVVFFAGPCAHLLAFRARRPGEQLLEVGESAWLARHAQAGELNRLRTGGDCRYRSCSAQAAADTRGWSAGRSVRPLVSLISII